MSPVLMETRVTLIEDDQCDKENSYCSEGLIGPGSVRIFATQHGQTKKKKDHNN